jgi:hypothetical protein
MAVRAARESDLPADGMLAFVRARARAGRGAFMRGRYAR